MASSLQDVFKRDENFFRDIDIGSKSNKIAVVLLYNEKYMGHIYGWQDEIDYPFFTYIGIRTSIENLLNREVKGISTLLVRAIVRFTEKFDMDRIEINQPIGEMPRLLKSMGFHYSSFNETYVFNISEGKLDTNDERPFILMVSDCVRKKFNCCVYKKCQRS